MVYSPIRPGEELKGNWIYYSKYDTLSIWKKPLQEGEETLVLNCNLEDHSQWDLVEDGIYYIKKADNVNFAINFYDFTNENITRFDVLKQSIVMALIPYLNPELFGK